VLAENEALAAKVYEGGTTLQGAIRKLERHTVKKWQVQEHVAKVGAAIETEENTHWQMVINGRLGAIRTLVKDLPVSGRTGRKYLVVRSIKTFTHSGSRTTVMPAEAGIQEAGVSPGYLLSQV